MKGGEQCPVCGKWFKPWHGIDPEECCSKECAGLLREWRKREKSASFEQRKERLLAMVATEIDRLFREGEK